MLVLLVGDGLMGEWYLQGFNGDFGAHDEIVHDELGFHVDPGLHVDLDSLDEPDFAGMDKRME